MSLLKERKTVFCIVDDDQMFRSKLVQSIKAKEPRSEILEFSSAKEVLALKSLKHIDFLILDYRMPEIDGIELLKHSSIQSLSIPKLLLSGFDAEERIFEALKFGATGYMLKEEIETLDSVLESLWKGGAYITPTLACRVASYFKSLQKISTEIEQLTERENQVLKELSQGYSPKDLADTLQISLQTIRTHIRNIYKKLEVNNQIQLMKKVKENFL